ncbi:MAG: T9SS type A sorting domain-containing protein, partial [Bacteroidota bacterium]
FVQSTDQMIELWRDNNNCSIAVDSTDLPDIDPSDNSTIRKYIYGDCSADTEIVLYKVFNGGHNLPGGAIQGPLSGNVNRDINGSVEIWRFFDQQTQTVLTSTSTVPKLPFDISIYPNPTAGWLHVQMSGDYSIEIFNAVGQSLVYSSNRAEVLDLSPLPDGLYYLKVANNRGEVTQKVVKRSSQF